MEAEEMKSVELFPGNTADHQEGMDISPGNTADHQEGVDIFPGTTADHQEGVDIFFDHAAEKQVENLYCPKDLLLSMEDDFARMHQILSTGIGACWEGDAFSSHRMLEEALFQRAEEALSRICVIV